MKKYTHFIFTKIILIFGITKLKDNRSCKALSKTLRMKNLQFLIECRKVAVKDLLMQIHL